MTKKVNKILSVVFLDDDEAIREIADYAIKDELAEHLLPDKQVEVKTVSSEQRAIDAMSMIEGKGLLVSDLELEPGRYPVQAWRDAAGKGISIAFCSNNDFEDLNKWPGFQSEITELKRNFRGVALSYIPKDNWIGLLRKLIIEKFPDFFKKESEPKDVDFGKGIRK